MTRLHKVAILGSLPPERGISAYCFELARSVSAIVPVEFISFKAMYPKWLYPGGGLRPDETFPSLDGTAVSVRRRLAWYNPLSWMSEGLFAPGDLLHVQFWSLPLLPIVATVMLLFRMRGRKIVVTLHNLESHDRSRLFNLGLWLMTRLADAVIVHAPSQVEELAQKFKVSCDRVRSIPHGVLEVFDDSPVDRTTARQLLNLPLAEPVVLFFGAIRPYKGLEILLEAFARVLADVPQAVLLVAGKPWRAWEPYAEIIRRLGLESRVRCVLDYVPANEVKHYFAASDLVALPYEHFSAQSGVALAALAFGKPMIVSDVGALKDLAPGPEFVVPPRDIEALAQAISLALTDDQLLAEACEAAAVMSESHQWGPIARRTAELYESLLAPVPSARRPAGKC